MCAVGLMAGACTHYPIPEHVVKEKVSYVALESFGRQMAEEFGVHFLLSGSGSFIAEEEIRWCLAFTSTRQLTLEEARPLAERMADRLWAFGMANPIFEQTVKAAQFDDYESFGRSKRPSFNRRQFGFRLAFWDEEVNRPKVPYLAQINFAGDKLLYFYADSDTQALLPPITEELRKK